MIMNAKQLVVTVPREHHTEESQETMRWFSIFVITVACVIGCSFSVFAADEEKEDSSAGLPAQYAKDYLVARSTVSPDKKFAVIYPTLEAEEAADNANHPERIKDYIVALEPFAILGELQTKYPYFQNENHGGVKAGWFHERLVSPESPEWKEGHADGFFL